MVDALIEGGPRWLAEVGDDPCAAVLDAEPVPVRTIADIDAAVQAVADFTDLKSRFFRGHSSGVAALAADGARAAGLAEDDVVDLGRAALVHDVGGVGVPSGIWDRPGPLRVDQWERVRLHPYLTERVLRRCGPLSLFAELAARHHERADGSGYHRGESGAQVGQAARLLAAADAYHAMGEARPHRPALEPAEAARVLLDEVDAGRFERHEVDAVLAAADQPRRPPNVARPAGLTEREVDVLRLIARGHANKEIRRRAWVSAKTVGHHIEHLYGKAGVSLGRGRPCSPWRRPPVALSVR